MKQGWEIKKLGEVVKKLFAGGDKPKLFAEYQTEQLSIPVYANGISLDGLVGYTDKAIVEEESITISARGTIGFCCVRKSPFVPIVRLITLIPSEDIKTEYLCYVLRNTKFDNNGVAIPQLTIPMIREMLIPIPPREEQERIVEELDCLSGVIEKKREQLRELDALAQSIFYLMFGDPITNEKGWEVKRLKDVCSDIIDGDHNPPPKSDNGIPFITISNINKDTKTIELANTYYVTEDYYNSIKPNKKPKKGDVLYTVTGSYGLPVLIKEDIRFCFQRHIGLLRPTDVINSVYLYIWAMLPQTKYQADDIATGIAQKTVSLSGLKQMSIILPPLTLQQEFADKIEAIEKQKALIKQSITQTEELFNARMDYYFN